ncbi:XrtA/PEP-CTERM system TPR-repeat protein PrsT [Roseococcus sp. SYP-B2431]|uniref:XrtA/PEP-CTERM system TPR-repeat protein PrsT n=1 Tax=Roseococcus sp. SYP-B2431 TaxID=2496640 RepID=UPI0013F412B2|nr:XrtA/PEP-CTERM system TPR-repeat protein PrsT [Roseococcus sp. SYP-B2431]
MRLHPVVLSLTLAGSLAGLSPAQANPARDRALAAQSRGELRAAQIEWRNAVRAEPTAGALRAGLASASLDVGDVDTAEREARAALERGYERSAGTALLLRVILAQARFQDVLAQFPEPGPDMPPAVAAQIAAGRALAQIGSGDREAARASVALAERLGAAIPEVGVAAAGLAMAEGDRAAAEARIDRVLATHPGAREARLVKAQLQLDRSDAAGALATFDGLITAAPGDVPARLRRAEVLLRLAETERASVDIDAAIAAMPTNAMAAYLRAMQLTIQRNWRAADTALQRLGPQVASFPDGLLLQATAKRGLGQTAQAEDAARRHVARFPEDPRGARLLGSIELEAGRPAEAAAVLARAAVPGTRDVELLEMLGRAYAGAGRHAEAVQALERAVALTPANGALLTRLAVARLALGDSAGTREAVAEAMRVGPVQPGAREMLVATAVARGDLAGAEAELAAMPPEVRQGEVGAVLAGTLRLIHLDLGAARTEFEAAIRRAPASRMGRLGLARVAALQGHEAEAVALVAAVVRDDPANLEAIRRLAHMTLGAGAATEPAVAALIAAQAAHPDQPDLALATAEVLVRRRETDRAVALLQAAPLRRARGAAMALARSEVHAAAGQWGPAEEAAREALAEDPASAQARVQLARLLLRAEDARGAENLIREGLRAEAGNARLQQALIGLLFEKQGLEAALAEAGRIAAQPAAMPAAAGLRGEALMAARRPAEAAEAFQAAMAAAPGAALALRASAAWRAADRPDRAAAVLRDRLAAAPDDIELRHMLAQLDIVAGRLGEAEAGLRQVVARAPEYAMALNNLAWVVGERDDPAALAEAKGWAERAFYLAPNADTADTLGWLLARGAEPRTAVLLLRQAGETPGTAYRLAFALKAAGERQQALSVLGPALASGSEFPERARAERLRAELQN